MGLESDMDMSKLTGASFSLSIAEAGFQTTVSVIETKKLATCNIKKIAKYINQRWENVKKQVSRYKYYLQIGE